MMKSPPTFFLHLSLCVTAAFAQIHYEPYTFSTFAGSAGVGSADGMGNAALFAQPVGTALDSGGNLYVADSLNHTIRKITPTGVVSTFAGLASHIGSADGTGGRARFQFPTGAALDSAGNIYVADAGSNTIRKITPGGVVTTLGRFGRPHREHGWRR